MKISETLAQELIDNGGFSINYFGVRPIDGYMVSPYKEVEERFPLRPDGGVCDKSTLAQRIDDYAFDQSGLLEKPCHFLGGWNNNDIVYLDIAVRVSTTDIARRLAKHYHQLAYYDVAKGISVNV